MAGKTVAIGSDHAGFALETQLKSGLEAGGYTVIHLGTNGPESVDYPDFGFAVGEAIASGKAEMGVLVCGSGIGISIAANRNPAVRAAVVTNSLTAKLARRGHLFTEVPIRYDARSYAEGKKIGVRDGFNALYCILRYGLSD